MNSAKIRPTPAGPAPAVPSPSQYLKIAYSSKRFYRLMALARELGCSWQSIALTAIDELLDREEPLKNLP